MSNGPLGFPRLTDLGPLVNAQSADDLEEDIVVHTRVEDDGAVAIEATLYGEAEEIFTELVDKFDLSKEEMIDQSVQLAEASGGLRGDGMNEMVENAIARYLEDAL